MSSTVLWKLAAVFAVIAVGWIAGRARLLGPHAVDTLTRAGFNIFIPALLFRTTAGISLADLPWPTLAAYFGPTVVLLLATYLWQRHRASAARSAGATAGASGRPAPENGAAGVTAAVRGLSVTFSNTVQLGIPVVTALFGTAGLTVLIAIVSLHALVLLTLATILVETDLGRASARSVGARVGTVVRRSVVHPVVLPILLGLGYHATGRPIPAVIDDVLATLALAVIPVSLVTIGLSLQRYGMRGSVRAATALAAGKLLVHPATVFAVAAGLFGLRGLPLVVAVLCAALPTGANVLLFAGRYDTAVSRAGAPPALAAETTATIVTSTTAFVLTATLWLLVLGPLMR